MLSCLKKRLRLTVCVLSILHRPRFSQQRILQTSFGQRIFCLHTFYNPAIVVACSCWGNFLRNLLASSMLCHQFCQQAAIMLEPSTQTVPSNYEQATSNKHPWIVLLSCQAPSSLRHSSVMTLSQKDVGSHVPSFLQHMARSVGKRKPLEMAQQLERHCQQVGR